MPVAAPVLRPIVTASWLLEQGVDCVVIDTRRPSEYSAGHIPGAINLQLGSLLVENTARASLGQLGTAVQRALASRGVSARDHVVLVDDNDGSASVGVFLCELAGIEHASVVHGGLRAWLHAGGGVTSDAPNVEEADFAGRVSLRTIAAFEDLVTAGQQGVRLVDTRSQLEYEGIVGPPCCAYRGHIPGAINLEWAHLLAATGDLLGPDAIRDQARHVGLDLDDDIIVYCHSGHRSAVAGLALRGAGFGKVRNSLGSWHEWSNRGMVGALER